MADTQEELLEAARKEEREECLRIVRNAYVNYESHGLGHAVAACGFILNAIASRREPKCS